MPKNLVMPAPKKQKTENTLPHFGSEFYPHEISDVTVARKYLKDENKPINILREQKVKKDVKKGNGVVHLFNKDLRISDNHSLFKASQLKNKLNVPLIGLFVYCIEELYSHSVSNFKLRYQLDTLAVLKEELEKLHIPLVVLQVDKARDYVSKISDFMNEHQFYHLSANVDYEVDELRHLIDLHKLPSIEVATYDDTCIVKPGDLKSGKGTQYSIFSPWYKAWVKSVKEAGIQPFASPDANKPKDAKDLKFELPTIPEDLTLQGKQLQYYKKLYKSGEANAKEALKSYVKSNSILEYDENRNQLDKDVGSRLSPYFAVGSLSARTVLSELFNSGVIKLIDSGDSSIIQWVRQVAWRDFYKHVISNWPHLCMFRPFHLELSDIKWEYDKDNYDAWCRGQTGYPIVDAAMRELNLTGRMSNRGRMIVASFLSKHLLIDWRYGERYFMEHLIDADLASNNGGWGFSSSTGVDPQPYFRIFNPYLQSQRFDPNGDYIREWVHELKEVGKDRIHQPYEKNDDSINGYPKPIVEHKFGRQRALDRYNEARY